MNRVTNHAPLHVPPSLSSEHQAAAAGASRVRRQERGDGAMRETRAAGEASAAPALMPAALAESSVGFGYGQQQRWRRCEELGRGAHGTVYRALVLETGENIAVKQILTTGMSRSELQVRQGRSVSFQLCVVPVLRTKLIVALSSESKDSGRKCLDSGKVNRLVVRIYTRLKASMQSRGSHSSVAPLRVLFHSTVYLCFCSRKAASNAEM